MEDSDKRNQRFCRLAHLQLVVFGAGLGGSLTAGQVDQTQLATAHAAIGQVPALHHDAHNEVGAGALGVHLYGNGRGTHSAALTSVCSQPDATRNRQTCGISHGSHE